MRTEALYCRLIEDGGKSGTDGFDAHVAASILCLSFGESFKEGKSIVALVGLDGDELRALVTQLFPHAGDFLALVDPDAVVAREDDEACLLDLLQRCTTMRSVFEKRLAAMLARRAQRPNHLWQDLGLRNRGELSMLMARHFEPLAVRNSKDMKWKKFLYRTICRDTGYSLCTAPSCSQCDDFEICFGEESGESLLARVRREAETAG
jgi:nitrogen fixation protein NifQ